MFKCRLQEYAQRNRLPLPIYDTANDGKAHIPLFKCSVTIDDAKYESPQGYRRKKEAENAAAQVAIEDLLKQGFTDLELEETNLLRNFLSELASWKNVLLPTYQFRMEGDAHCQTFTASVEVNGVSYTGAPGRNKKAAARNAAHEAIRSICPQDCISISQFGLEDENAPALEKVPENIIVGNPCLLGQGLQKSIGKDSSEAGDVKPNVNNANAGSATAEPPPEDLFLVQQHQMKEEGRWLPEDMECGYKEFEGKQQGRQDVLTESIGTRSIRGKKKLKKKRDTKMKKMVQFDIYENAEQMSKKKKKIKRKGETKRENMVQFDIIEDIYENAEQMSKKKKKFGRKSETKGRRRYSMT